MSIFKHYNKFKVAITIYKNGQSIKRMQPEVGDMDTAHSIGKSMQNKLNGDNYTAIKIAGGSDLTEYGSGIIMP